MKKYIVQMRLSTAKDEWLHHLTVDCQSDRIDMLTYDLFNVFLDELKISDRPFLIKDLEFRAVESETLHEVVRVGFD
jgi:hypothetical protein